MLTPNDQTGPFKVISLLGKGGMGEVYLALDSRLDRKVALKLLPRQFARDAERLSRFEFEARTLASLNHPNIMVIYEVGADRSSPYLVSELLEGETLRERMDAGPIPLRKAVDYATQIADGLAAAHSKGIVHRDLKPDNIFITRDGIVKILDFGLAQSDGSRNGSTDALDEKLASPDSSSNKTIMGTVGYMSPEQIQGAEPDSRSDLFAFGTILYEMLSGVQPFHRHSTSATLSAVVQEEPPDLQGGSQSIIPVELLRIIQRCLEKNPEERFQSAKDLRFALLAAWDILSNPAATTRSTSWLTSRERELIAWSTAAVLLAACIGLAVAYVKRPETKQSSFRLSVLPPDGSRFVSGALSPNGQHLAFVATDLTYQRRSRLWIRSLQTGSMVPLNGTEGAQDPFWSPDSTQIAFFSQGKLMRIAIDGKSPVVICNALAGGGGTWTSKDEIVFASGLKGSLLKISSKGGDPVPITRLDTTRKDDAHLWPYALPDGERILFQAHNATNGASGTFLISLAKSNAPPQKLLDSTSLFGFAAGNILYSRNNTLFAQSFDLERTKVEGEPKVLSQSIGGGATASTNGVLALISGQAPRAQLQWFDRAGNRISSLGQPGYIFEPSLSLDGKLVATSRADPESGTLSIWLANLERNSETRFTPDSSYETAPTFSPDSKQLVFAKSSGAGLDLAIRNLENGTFEVLHKSDIINYPEDWSRDGKYIVFSSWETIVQSDIWVIPTFGNRKPVPFLKSRASEYQGRLSPDGRWMAYVSDEEDRVEVYVTNFPEGTTRKRVSTGGGADPVWSADGQELFYLATDRTLMSVLVRQPQAMEFDLPKPLFRTKVGGLSEQRNHYAVSADRVHFIVLNQLTESASTPATIVLNWPTELRQK